ncbi:MAG: hypothetical protein EBU43_05790 [Actinobacteria bacterium]|uniref:Unannotated protein n=1 Tax=freshwater metagenome TaxID=449393 RepID=A0A6J7BFZ6_9ZZZZ|nr:hypothetical protein [Actinomycetota bacterium]MSY51158.1 hypothetical protein [Actinomycetota bacterium]NBP91843.1 hypothetical protein [Actinomycetota bacterium]
MNEVERWSALATQELGIAIPIDIAGILDLTKEVAHGVTRPAAPVAAYLLGLVQGSDPSQVAVAEATLRRLAAEWEPDSAR